MFTANSPCREPRCWLSPLTQSICLIVLLSICIDKASAKIDLPFIFNNHAVLQAGQPLPVWGKAASGEKVTVEFAGQVKTTTVDSQGHWTVKLDPLAANSDPGTLVIRDSDGELDLTDILVGEVWFCSGQSNMAMTLGNGGPKAPNVGGVLGGEDEIARPEDSSLRLFCWEKQNKGWAQAGLSGWQRANSISRAPFSATAYFFGNALQKAMKVPVGLINVSAGGSPITPWMPREDAMKLPMVSHYLDIYTKDEADIKAYNRLGGRYQDVMRQNPRPVPPPLPPDPLPYEEMMAGRIAGFGLYESFVAPVVPYGIRGVIWYQGEANSDNLELATDYEEMLRMLITSWREKWGQSDFPFYFVQLPCWDAPHGVNWHVTRQGMLNVLNSMTNVGMAVTVDVGDSHNLHPPNKRPVGERLALWALAKVYHQPVVFSGPLVKKIANEGEKLRVSFNTCGSTLKIHGAAWRDLEVAGEDGLYYPAVAVLGDTDALVSSPSVSKPIKARYGWKPVFTPTLFNQEGLPASPFSLSFSDLENLPK